jgi:hypothetical protein
MTEQPDERHYLRKAAGMEVHAVAHQVAIYDPQADRIHYLNPTAALILELSDGSHSSKQIAALVQEAYGLAEAPVAAVEDCLSGLKKAGIVH